MLWRLLGHNPLKRAHSTFLEPYRECWRGYIGILFGRPIKLGIHLRQRQAEVRHSSLSSASVDGAPSWATYLRGFCDPSHRVWVDQSEASPRNSPPYVQYGWNMPCLAETEKHYSVRGAAHRGCCAAPQLASASNVFPALGMINPAYHANFIGVCHLWPE